MLVLVVLPCFFTILDVNIFSEHQRGSVHLAGNIVISLSFVLFRILVLPGFCMLTVILYLLADHIRITGMRICVQKNITDAERLIVQNIRKFTRKTQEMLSVIVFVHMLLIFSSSFTTSMSTIERLELTYKTNKTTSVSTMHVAFKHDDQLPFSELINTKLELKKSKELIN